MEKPEDTNEKIITCRLGTISDIDEICKSIDDRSFIRSFLERSVASSSCHVTLWNKSFIVGYAVLDYSFYAQALISMLRIHPAYRRQCVGITLMRYLEEETVTMTKDYLHQQIYLI